MALLAPVAAVADQLSEVLKVVEQNEAYTHFLTTEKEAISGIDDAYMEARNRYLITLKFEMSKGENPNAALKPLMQHCGRNDKFAGNAASKSYGEAAWAIGMRMLVDRPSFSVDLSGVEVTRDLTYAVYDNIELQLDLFRPKNRSGKLPVIVCIHGGGWRVHRRAWFAGHAGYFAAHGLAAVTVDYRKLPAVKSVVPAIEDVKAAVRWVRANAERYGLDSERIGAIGGSAGAHLTTMLATSSGVKELEGAGGNQQMSSAIQAGVGYATPSVNPEAMESSRRRRSWYTPELAPLISPYMNVDSDSAPMYFIHGTADKTVPIGNSHELHQKYQDAGAQSELKVLDGKPHVFYTNAEAAGWALEFFRAQFGIGK